LDIKGPDLVKGIHMEGLRVLGQPELFARHYYESGADELVYVDAVASLYGRNSLLPIIERTARETFIPLTVAGGLRSVDDIRAVLRAGADKVAINTAAIATPEFIKEAARVFGSSTITVGIEVVRGADGTYEAFTDFGRESTGVDAFQWAVRAVELGAGELMVTSIDREGTGTGFDLELIRRISEAVPVPVIASGGAGSVQHVYEVIAEGKADAVCLASLLHYNYVRHTDDRASDIAEAAGNVEFLRGGAGFSMIRDAPLEEIRSFLASMGIATRQV
jgi:cyclase